MNFNSKLIKGRKYKPKIYIILTERNHKEKFSFRFDEKMFYRLNILLEPPSERLI